MSTAFTTDGRDGQDVDQAKTRIIGMFGGRVEGIHPAEDGGWNLEMCDIPRLAGDMIDDYEEFDYSLLDAQNNDEVATYKETIVQRRRSAAGATGVILEGLYERRIGDDSRPQARISATLVFASDDEWEARVVQMHQRFADRTFGELVRMLGYIGDGLRTVRHYATADLATERMAEMRRLLGGVNRDVIDMGGANAA